MVINHIGIFPLFFIDTTEKPINEIIVTTNDTENNIFIICHITIVLSVLKIPHNTINIIVDTMLIAKNIFHFFNFFPPLI